MTNLAVLPILLSYKAWRSKISFLLLVWEKQQSDASEVIIPLDCLSEPDGKNSKRNFSGQSNWLSEQVYRLLPVGLEEEHH